MENLTQEETFILMMALNDFYHGVSNLENNGFIKRNSKINKETIQNLANKLGIFIE